MKWYHRYVTDSLMNQWHIVNEKELQVYIAPTLCGMTFKYPSRTVVFLHPKDLPVTSTVCETCKVKDS